MIIHTVFELDSIKDQLALLKSLRPNLDNEDINNEYQKLVDKMNNLDKNLTQKYEDLRIILDN